MTVNSVRVPSYYAFDDRTNIVAGASASAYPAAGRDGYWNNNPVGSHPSLRTRDGAPWVSVPTGAVAEVEIHLDRNSAACLTNCTFRVQPSSVATAVTTSVATRQANFHIQGARQGEAALIVSCNGSDIGWFRIWCKPIVTLNLDCYQVQYGTSGPSLNINQASLTDGLNKTFRQALIQFNVTYQTVAASPALIALEAQFNTFSSAIGNSATDLHFPSGTAIQQYMNAVIPSRSRTGNRNGYMFHKPRGSRQVTVPANGRSATSFAGVVAPLNDKRGWSYNSSLFTFAHEVGHMLGLGHPMQTDHGLPAHLIASLNTRPPNRPATNTDDRISGESVHPNVMALDPQNIMGYPRNRNVAGKLRLGQWEKCRRR